MRENLITNLAPQACAYKAQAILYMARGYEFPVILPDTEGNYSYTVFKQNTEPTQAPHFTTFIPNPSNSSSTLSYHLPTDAQAVLTLTDINGKIQQKALLIGSGIYNLDTRLLCNGLYLYTVQQNGNVLLRDKLIVIK